MTARPDDDALTWDGDDDPTLDTGLAPVPAPSAEDESPSAEEPPTPEGAADGSLPDGFTAVGKGSEALDHPAAVVVAGTAVAREPMGNVALVTIGILGGFYLLFTIGWAVGGFRLQGRVQSLVADVMFQGSFWLAVLAPALWFGTVFLLTRHSAGWVRIVWLVAGAILLVPWPFIMVGAIGQ